MSLTSMLVYNNDMKELFAEVPNVKHLFKTLNADGTPFPPNASSHILVKRAGKANPVIGHAYDYWLRSYVQRANGIHIEKSTVDLAASVAVKLLSSSGLDLRLEYLDIIKRRNEYIAGERDDDTIFMEDCMKLAGLDVYYRAGYIPEHGLTGAAREDVTDLFNLANETKNYTSFFTVREKLICNPEFGMATILLEGADADLIIDGTLIEIKTESSFGYKASHIRQLIAYYMLSRLTPSFGSEITRLAVFNPRYCRFIYLDIEELAKEMDLRHFMDRFVGAICDPYFAEDNNRATPTLKQIQHEIWTLYHAY